MDNQTKSQRLNPQSAAHKKVILQRLNKIMDLYMEGKTEPEIVALAQLEFNITTTNVRKYIRQCNNWLIKQANVGFNTNYTRYIGQLDYVYRMAIEKNDPRTAMAVLKQKAEVQGVIEIAKRKSIKELEDSLKTPELDITPALNDLISGDYNLEQSDKDFKQASAGLKQENGRLTNEHLNDSLNIMVEAAVRSDYDGDNQAEDELTLDF